MTSGYFYASQFPIYLVISHWELVRKFTELIPMVFYMKFFFWLLWIIAPTIVGNVNRLPHLKWVNKQVWLWLQYYGNHSLPLTKDKNAKFSYCTTVTHLVDNVIVTDDTQKSGKISVNFEICWKLRARDKIIFDSLKKLFSQSRDPCHFNKSSRTEHKKSLNFAYF
jgi:hypothetical protein